VTVAVVAALLAAFVVGGLQAAFAADDGPGPRVVADADFYFQQRAAKCSAGSGDCVFGGVGAFCATGDEAIGGTGWAISPTDRVTNMAAAGLEDRPVGTRGWRVVSPEDTLGEGWEVRVRVYCANTG
jgi:hypothetical protein